MAVSRKNNDAPKAASQDKFGEVVKKVDRARQDQKDAASDVGNAYQYAETWGFDRTALKLALKIRDMEVAKRNDFLTNLNTYLDWMGVNAQTDLFNDVPTGVANGSDGSEPNANVAHLQGEKAGRAGLDANTNPHTEGSPAHTAWADGWLEGQRKKVLRDIKPAAETETHASA